MIILRRLVGVLFQLLTIFIFYGIPILTVVFFIRSLVRYVKARKANGKAPGTFSDEEMKKRLVRLIVSSVMMAVLVAAVIGIVWLLYMAVAYM